MNNLLETILKLDSSGRYQDVLRYLHENRESPTVPHEIYQLLFQSHFLEAHILAQLFRNRGSTNPILMFAQAIGGYLFGNGRDELEGAAALSESVDSLTAEQRDVIGRSVVHPVISQVIMADASLVQDHGRALRLLEIYKAGLPMFRPIFDWTGTAPPLTLDGLRRQGRARAKLITFAGPPAGAPRKPLRVIVAVRKYVFPGKADSRAYDIGPRLENAMNTYGWRASFYEMVFEHRQDFAGITQLCTQEKADILFLDDYQILAGSTLADRLAMITHLRQKLPNLKIVSIHLDPWAIEPSVLVKTSADVDAVWAPFPSSPVWDDPVFANKVVLMQHPHAGNSGHPVTPLTPRMKFTGGVFGYNWHRIMWLAGVVHGLPLDVQMSTHTADGLSVLDSYAHYMRRLETSACALNFSMRPDLSRIFTGRCFESMLAGALLVQEEAPDMDYYFIAGEHYLTFTTVPELRAVARFIAEKLEEAEEIRRAGNAFARARYSDDKIMGHVEKILYYRD